MNDATEVIVSLNDRREFVAEVVGVDMLSDIAVLKIEGDKLPSLRMGKSKRLKVGESVIAIGSHSVLTSVLPQVLFLQKEEVFRIKILEIMFPLYKQMLQLIQVILGVHFLILTVK